MCVGGYCVHTYTQVYIDLKGYYMSSGNGRWGEWAFSDLEMKRERSKEKRDGEDIEYDHVASITAIYTIRIVGTVAAFCRKVFCVIVFPLACCETRLHFIPNTNSVFISPRYSLFQQCLTPLLLSLLLDVAPDSCQFIERETWAGTAARIHST